ncbi:MAG: major capsid family protein [Saprospiraceae bacterium]
MHDRLDANETVFFDRELENVRTREYNIKFPNFKARQYIPVDTSADEGDLFVTYNQFTELGVSEFISDYASNLPLVNATGQQFTVKIKDHGNAFQMSNKEIRSSKKANKKLKLKLGDASRRAYEQLVDNLAWLGDGTAAFGGLFGLVYNPNVTSGAAPNGTWASATPDAIIADVNFAINGINTLTNTVEQANTCLMSPANFKLIASTPRSGTSDTTILKFLKDVHPTVKFDEISKLVALDPKPSGGAGPTEILIAMSSTPETLTLDIPMEYRINAPQHVNLAQVVNTEGSIAGVIIPYPLAISIIEGL